MGEDEDIVYEYEEDGDDDIDYEYEEDWDCLLYTSRCV